MHAAGHPAEQPFGGVGRLFNEIVHVIPAGKVQVAPQFAVERIFHGHIHHGAALIHHGVQLGAHLVGGAVDTGQNAGVPAGGRVELITAGRGLDGSAPARSRATSPTTICRETPNWAASTLALTGASAPLRRFNITSLRCAAFKARSSLPLMILFIIADPAGMCKLISGGAGWRSWRAAAPSSGPTRYPSGWAGCPRSPPADPRPRMRPPAVGTPTGQGCRRC